MASVCKSYKEGSPLQTTVSSEPDHLLKFRLRPTKVELQSSISCKFEVMTSPRSMFILFGGRKCRWGESGGSADLHGWDKRKLSFSRLISSSADVLRGRSPRTPRGTGDGCKSPPLSQGPRRFEPWKGESSLELLDVLCVKFSSSLNFFFKLWRFLKLHCLTAWIQEGFTFFFFFQVRTSGCDALDSGGQRSAARMTKIGFREKIGLRKNFLPRIGFGRWERSKIVK